jgi:hypothetical protein
MLLVIDTDCIGSCKSNYHTIMTTTAPIYFYVFFFDGNIVSSNPARWEVYSIQHYMIKFVKADRHDITEILLHHNPNSNPYKINTPSYSTIDFLMEHSSSVVLCSIEGFRT